MIGDLIKMLGAIGKGLTKPSPAVAREMVNGVGVSTVLTSDMGYETALIDSKGTHPVERYETEDQAKEGHIKWTGRIREGWLGVIEIGYGEIITDKMIKLVPFPEETKNE